MASSWGNSWGSSWGSSWDGLTAFLGPFPNSPFFFGVNSGLNQIDSNSGSGWLQFLSGSNNLAIQKQDQAVRIIPDNSLDIDG